MSKDKSRTLARRITGIGKQKLLSALILVASELPFSCAAQTSSASAQTNSVDVTKAAAQLLSTLGPIPWTHTQSVMHTCNEVGPGDRPIKVPCWSNETVTTSNILTASNFRISSYSPLQYTITNTQIPSQLLTNTGAWENCSKDTPVGGTDNLQVSFTRSSSAAVTNTVSNTQSSSFNLSVNISGVLTLSGSVRVGATSSTATTDTNSYTQIASRTKTINFTIQPQKAIGNILEVWPVVYTANFATNATIDADLSSSDKGYAHLSDVASPNQRTFPITGTVQFVDASAGQGFSYDVDYVPAACPLGATGIVTIPVPAAPTPGLSNTTPREVD